MSSTLSMSLVAAPRGERLRSLVDEIGFVFFPLNDFQNVDKFMFFSGSNSAAALPELDVTMAANNFDKLMAELDTSLKN